MTNTCPCRSEKHERITKVADFVLSNCKCITSESAFIKQASSKKDGNNDFQRVLKEEIAKHPEALFFRAKAIEADVPNNNGDYFSVDELKKSAQTFVGVPFFTNHQNQDIEKAKGKVVYAEWDDEAKAIYVIAFVDRKAYPHLCRGIEQEYVSGVSMGCSVEYSLCSICNNRAASQEEYCYHIRNMKGRKFSGQATDVKTGETRSFSNAHVYEKNFGIRFIELSGVVDPACPSCRIGQKFKNDDMLKAAATRCANGLAMFKTSELFQEASDQDIQSLNQALQTLQDIAIKLIQNRQNVEMEFPADLVKILSELQEFVDGLVQAGFGKIQDQPGTAPAPGAEAPAAGGTPAPAPDMGLGAPVPGQPVSAEQPLGAPGEVSGNPGAPLASAPVSPQDLASAARPAPGGLKSTLIRPSKPKHGSTDGDEEMRRIPTKISEEKKKVSSRLENDWQEKLQKVSNILKESIRSDVNSNNPNNSGGPVMSKITQEAKAKEAPMETLEKQLDEKIRLHPRTEKVNEAVEEAQLDPKREGKEPNDTEQVLLDAERTGKLDETVEENQLKGNRKGDVKEETEQVQLESRRTDANPNDTLQALLSKPPTDTPSSRSASSVKAHVEAAVGIVGQVVAAAQTTPERAIRVAGVMASLPIAEQVKIASSISSFDGSIPANENFAKRATFWQSKGLQVTAASDKEIKDMVIAYSGLAAKSAKLNPEMLIRAFAALKNNPRSVEIVTAKVVEIVKNTIDQTEDVDDVMSAHISTLAPVTASEGKCDCCPDCKCKAGCKCEKCQNAREKTSGTQEASSKSQMVKAETEALLAAVKTSSKKPNTMMIETSFEEMGIPADKRGDDAYLKSACQTFARGACANLGVKVAAVVNVTVDGESGDVVIAVDTENGSVEIPVGEKDKGVDETIGSEDKPEEGADLGGADLTPPPAEPTAEATPPATGAESPAAGAATAAPAAPAAGGAAGLGSFTETKGKNIKKAQFGGGGAAPGAAQGGMAGGAGQSPDPSAGTTMPPAPDAAGIGSFTEGDAAGGEGDELPGDEEQKEAGTICPFCGGEAEGGRKDQSPGQYECTSCKVKYNFNVMVEVLNPEEVVGSKEESAGINEEDMKEPKVPSMPVAAETSINRDSLRKIAKLQQEVGHVCPACGSVEVETSGAFEDVKIACKKCKTESEKSVLINIDNPVESVMRVAWSLDPMKRKCASCRDSAKKFAAEMVFNKMMKVAAAKKDFPEATVRAWLAANYPDAAYVSNGPFKGQSFADTIVRQLKTFGFSKAKYLKRLAEIQAMEDPMDTCISDNKKKGYTFAESERLCNCLKEKYASEEDSNVYMQAFAGMIDTHILRKMAEHDSGFVKTANAEATDDDADISTLKVEVPQGTAEIKKSLASLFPSSKADVKTAADKDVTKMEYGKNKDKKVSVEETIADGAPEKPSASRSKQNDELTEKIPGPKVPRGDATMGKETKPPKEGVDVPSKEKSDTSSLGQVNVEATEDTSMKKSAYSEQETMSRSTKEVKNPDSTSGDTALDEKSVSNKKPQKSECLEEATDVDVPSKGGKATINNEQPAATEGPKVPRGDAKMGNEAPPEAKEPEIPSEVGDTNTKFLGKVNVEAERSKQMEKIAAARREYAMRYAGQMLERGLIKEEDVESFVKDMSALPLDRMKTHVAMLMKANTKEQKQVTASVALTTPIVRESETITTPKEEPTLAEKLSGMFTVGGPKNDRFIRMAEAEKEKEEGQLRG